MILKNLNNVEKQTVTMQGAEKVQMQLLCGPADGCPTFAMRKFIVAPGGFTPKHQHDYEHEVLILSGEGVVFGNNKEQPHQNRRRPLRPRQRTPPIQKHRHCPPPLHLPRPRLRPQTRRPRAATTR